MDAAQMRAKAAASVNGVNEAENMIRLAADKLDQEIMSLMSLSDHQTVAAAIVNLQQAKAKLEEVLSVTVQAVNQVNSYTPGL